MKKFILALLFMSSLAFANVLTHSSYNQTGGAEGHPDSITTVVDEDTQSGFLSDSDGDSGTLESTETNPLTGITIETWSDVTSGGGGDTGEPRWMRRYNWTIAYDEEGNLSVMKTKVWWNDDNGDGKMDDDEIQHNDFSDEGESMAQYDKYSVSVGTPGTIDV